MTVNTANLKAFLKVGLMSLLFAVRRQSSAFSDSGAHGFPLVVHRICSEAAPQTAHSPATRGLEIL